MTPSPELVAFLAGAALAFALHFAPKLNTFFDALDSLTKRLILAALCVVAAWVLEVVRCQWNLQCAIAAGDGVMNNAGLAIAGSQVMYAMVREWIKRNVLGPQ